MWRAAFPALVLAACTQFPQLDETIDPSAEAADFPELVPLEPILAGLEVDPDRHQRTEDALTARADALRARAARLQQDVVDADTRDRMRRGVPQG